MSRVDQQYEDLIEQIYNLVNEPCSVNAVLQNIVELLNCNTCGIISNKQSDHTSKLLAQAFIDPSFIIQYDQHFNRLDPTFNVLNNKQDGLTINHTSYRYIPKDNIQYREFINDFVIPQDHKHTAAINITSCNKSNNNAWIWTRNSRQRAFSNHENVFFERLAFHMKNALYKLEHSNSNTKLCPLKLKKLSTLSSRENQVLKLISQGQRRQQISKCLSISVHTVDEHRKKIREKLSIHYLNEDNAYDFYQLLIN